MFKSFLIFLVCILGFTATSNASVYILGQMGVYSLSSLKDEIKNLENTAEYNSSFGAGIGSSNMLDTVRTELSYMYHSPQDFVGVNATSKQNMHSILARGFVNFINFGIFKIHGGLGLGMLLSHYDIDDKFSIPQMYNYYRNNPNTRDFVMYFGGGATVGFTDFINLDFTYNYLRNLFKDDKTVDTSFFNNNDIKMSNITLGLRIGF